MRFDLQEATNRYKAIIASGKEAPTIEKLQFVYAQILGMAEMAVCVHDDNAEYNKFKKKLSRSVETIAKQVEELTKATL